MPLKIRHLDGGRGLFAKATGRLSGNELIFGVAIVNPATLAEMPVLYAIVDFNGVTEVAISTDQLHAAAEISIEASRRQQVGRLVAIYAKGDLMFALARMWLVFVEQTGWQAIVCRERSEAVSWVRERMATLFGVQVPPDLDV